MVQKLLDELVSAGTVKLQEYGKSKIYYANQVYKAVRIDKGTCGKKISRDKNTCAYPVLVYCAQYALQTCETVQTHLIDRMTQWSATNPDVVKQYMYPKMMNGSTRHTKPDA